MRTYKTIYEVSTECFRGGITYKDSLLFEKEIDAIEYAKKELEVCKKTFEDVYMVSYNSIEETYNNSRSNTLYYSSITDTDHRYKETISINKRNLFV